MTEYATPRERASAAMAEFRRRIPLMTGFARSFSGNQRVQIKPVSHTPRTDGNIIYLEVPLKMAEKLEHDRELCGQWDSQGYQMCAACTVVDDLNYTLFHEISHIWGGSFEKPTTWGQHEAIKAVEEYLPEPQGKVSYEGIIKHPDNDTWLKVGGRINPFLGDLVNCFEDARVNEKMARVRPGVRMWRRAFERRLVSGGIRRFDPRTNQESWFRVTEAPLNAQMAMAFYFMASGDSVPSEFDEYVLKQVADPRVQQLASEAVGNVDPDKTFLYAVRAYALMADMGFFGNEDKLQQDQDDQGAPLGGGDDDEDSDEADGSSGNSEGSEGDRPEEDEESEVSSYSGSSDDSEGGGDDSQPSDESDSSDADLDPGEAGEDGRGEESTDGPGDESEDDGEASDGDAENPSEDEDPGHADSAHEGEDDPGAGGESEADELGDEPDEPQDGSNAGETGDGAQEDAEGSEAAGDSPDPSVGENSLAEGGDPEPDDVNDDGGTGEASGSDSETGSDADGSDESAGGGQDSSDGEADPEGNQDVSGDAGGDDEEHDGESGQSSDGADESGDSDASDDTSGGASDLDEDGTESADQDPSIGTGEPGDSTEGEPGDESDGEAGGGAGDSPDGTDLEPSDGVDEDFDGDPTGESDGGEGKHGEDGPSVGASGGGASTLSGDGPDDDTAMPEEADVDPEESPDDTPQPDREWGDAQEVHERLEEFFGHHSPNEDEDEEVIEELEHIIKIGDVFDNVPRQVSEVWWNRWQQHYAHPSFGDQATSWTHKHHWGYWFHNWSHEQIGIAGDFRVGDSVLGNALLRARRAFADNVRKKDVRNLKAGRVNGRALGKRAPIHDPRLFKKIDRPGKRDYFVVIGLDLSASTASGPTGQPTNLALIKRSAMAQCEILSRLGVKFAVYGHSAKNAALFGEKFAVNMYVVKEAHEPWNEQTKQRLEALGPDEGNLDGHTLQLYRKIAEKQNVTDRIVMYYTDGQIPALNGEEEGEVLAQQINHCRKEGITLMGVGIRTDSLAEFGFDYTRVDGDDDLVKVVNNLEKRLAEA